MIIVFTVVLVSNVVSLRNTDKWVSNDVCCNLMRSQPACCTKSCGGNKHCCARLSCAHTASAVLTTLFFIIFGILYYAGCTESVDSTQYNRQYDYDSYSYSSHFSPDDSIASAAFFNFVSIAVMSMFQVSTLVLLICLSGTTSRSAWLLRQIEKNQPDVVLLPPGKMVVQDANMMTHTPAAHDACIIDDVLAKTGRETEQNV